jgi:hypothetical protein
VCAKTPGDARLMGLDVVDLFFNFNLPGFPSHGEGIFAFFDFWN